MVDAAVHEPEAVGRTDDSIDGQVEDGSAMNRHVRQITTVPLPRIGEVVFNSSENDIQSALIDVELGILETNLCEEVATRSRIIDRHRHCQESISTFTAVCEFDLLIAPFTPRRRRNSVIPLCQLRAKIDASRCGTWDLPRTCSIPPAICNIRPAEGGSVAGGIIFTLSPARRLQTPSRSSARRSRRRRRR